MNQSQRKAFVHGMLAAGELMLAFDRPNWKGMKPALYRFIGQAAEEIKNGQDFSILLAKYIEENEKSQIAWAAHLKVIDARNRSKLPWWNFWGVRT